MASKKFKRGDTLIEVMFAVAIFGMVSVGAIQIMNRGIHTAQGALETTMARQEIDTQAEALRFIHNAYVSESANATNKDLMVYVKVAVTKEGDQYSVELTDPTGNVITSGTNSTSNGIVCSDGSGNCAVVSIEMSHSSHGCNRLFKFKLSDMSIGTTSSGQLQYCE